MTAVFIAAFAINAYAGNWVQDSKGWWYDWGNGSWPASSWHRIDGNLDGVAEFYYFDRYGYCIIKEAEYNSKEPVEYTGSADLLFNGWLLEHFERIKEDGDAMMWDYCLGSDGLLYVITSSGNPWNTIQNN